MPHLCPVCQKESWHKLDSIAIICPKCNGRKSIQTGPDTTAPCDLCQGKGGVNFQLRDQKVWFDKNVLYDEPVGMKVCKSCGFVTYEPRWTEEKLKEYYTKERSAVNPGLIIRSKVKNAFHKFFLGDAMDSINSVLDIGCSFGYIRGIFPEAKIYGIEFSSNFCKYARGVNHVDLISKTLELPKSCVNLVMIYHTLEHTNNPRETLLEAKRVLKDGGYLYVAVPDYLGQLREVSNMACLDFEELYHINHNNVFSHVSFNNLLRQCGFEVIKMDNQYYGEAVLCKVNESIDKTLIVEDWAAIENKLYRQKIAIDILSKCYKNPNSEQAVMGIEAALAQYPAYVDAYEAYMVQKDIYKNATELEKIYKRAEAAGGVNLHLKIRYATTLLNWADAGQNNNYVRRAEELFKECLAVFPYEFEALVMLSKINAYNYKNPDKAEEYGNLALELNPMMWGEIQSIIAHARCLE